MSVSNRIQQILEAKKLPLEKRNVKTQSKLATISDWESNMESEREAIELRCGIIVKNPQYSKTQKEGYLWKKGKVLGNWSRRYFIQK